MGNCCGSPSSMSFASNDWDCNGSPKMLDCDASTQYDAVRSPKMLDCDASTQYDAVRSPEMLDCDASTHYDAVRRDTEVEEKRLRDEEAKASTEVKIRITKKQLEELLNKHDIQGMSVEQVLIQLMRGGSSTCHVRHRSWQPTLQSIPEINELT